MRKSLSEIGQMFDTDKTLSGYTVKYERHIGNLRDAEVTLLELGVHRGGSLLMWQEYLPNAKIVGLDINKNPLAEREMERIHFFQGSQDDSKLLDRIATEHAPDGFDIIIDDAAHIGTLARAAFLNLFTNHLKSGGIYVIEDWGTGYWDTWPDGNLYEQPNAGDSTIIDRKGLMTGAIIRRILRRFGFSNALAAPSSVDPNFSHHNFGMVGFIKELIDQVAWGDITRPGQGNEKLSGNPLGVKNLNVYQGQVFIEKQ